jgi:hypothetical protein
MKKTISCLIILVFSGVFVSCRSVSTTESGRLSSLYQNYMGLSEEDKIVADSLLTLALDNEGLFTICTDLKPISTVRNAYFKIAKDSTMKDGISHVVDPNHNDLKKIMQATRVLERLETDRIGFMVEPFKVVWKSQQRAMEIVVYRKDLIADMVKRKQAFFGQWGFVPATNAELIINTIEYESKYDRFRGYGYLFGYPDHAVDFFVSASQKTDSTGKELPREFLHMPSYGGEGRFVYAVAKGSGFTQSDSLIYQRAKLVTETYKVRREKYRNGTKLQAALLIRDWEK